MNKYQRLVLIVALVDALIMVLFPPFNSHSLVRGVLPSFDGFYPLITQVGNKSIHRELLSLQLMFVAANGLAAWLLLQQEHPHDIPEFRFSRAIGLFAVANLAIILLFPPFEPYPTLARQAAGSTFESFYFILGDRSKRPIFVPLLYMECVFLAVNTLALWLLFSAVRRGEDATRRKIEDLAETLDETALAALNEEMRHRVLAHRTRNEVRLGRGPDRRHHETPDFPGPERRDGHDRRHHEVEDGHPS